MATRVYWIERFSNGARLGIMARPRGEEWLHDEIEHLKKQNVLVLASLLETSEENELKLEAEAEVCALIAGAVLLLNGQTTKQIIEKITAARGLKVPDTDDQVAWLRKRERAGSGA